jgi:hypothetical protein
MSTNSEQEQPTVESPPTVSTETENLPPASSTTDDNKSVATDQAPAAVEEQKNSSSSSWFNSLGIPPNLTNQLTNLSSSLMQVTSKMSAAANTLVQKTLPQRPSSPDENEQTEGATKHEEEQKTEQISEENTGAAGVNKDLTSECLITPLICVTRW